MSNIRNQIKELVEGITPYDNLEKEHIANTIGWIDSGVEIFRIESPNIPPKHLVCYTVLVDTSNEKILLLEHKKAGLLLPSGGHVDPDELPHLTALREIKEELNEDGDFLSDSPLFVTQTKTIGLTAGHIDVDLWYVFKRDSTIPLNDDETEFKREFGKYSWLTFKEILDTDIRTLDPHMHRFVKKLENHLR